MDRERTGERPLEGAVLGMCLGEPARMFAPDMQLRGEVLIAETSVSQTRIFRRVCRQAALQSN